MGATTPETSDSAGADAQRDSLIGHKLGEYVVEGHLGVGGMGVVYRGLQPLIGKPVAIKVLQVDLASNPVEAQRLLTEARAVNAIRHRGIVDIFSFGQLPDGRHYLVMELLEGQPLDAVIAAKAPLDPLTVVMLLDEILDAVAAAHDSGVIHRDLKPNNVFIVAPQYGAAYVKLLDFGLAKQGVAGARATPQTSTQTVVGTPYYMAPEQARAEAVSPATDLYAIGCMAFEMLTGNVPYDAPTAIEVLTKHLASEVPRVSSVLRGVSSELDDVVFRMMQKDVSARPASARVVRADLKRLRGGLQAERTQIHDGSMSESTGSGWTLDALVRDSLSRRPPSHGVQSGAIALEATVSRPQSAPGVGDVSATVIRHRPGGPTSDVVDVVPSPVDPTFQDAGPVLRPGPRHAQPASRAEPEEPTETSRVDGRHEPSETMRVRRAAAIASHAPPPVARRPGLIAAAVLGLAACVALGVYALSGDAPTETVGGAEVTPLGPPDDVKSAKPDDAPPLKPDDVKSAKPDDAPPLKPDDVKSAKPDDAPPLKPDDVKSAKPGDAKPPKSCDVKSAKPGDAKPPKSDDVKSAKSGDAKPASKGPSRESLVRRIDGHNYALEARLARGENVSAGRTLLLVLRASALKASTKAELDAVAADLADWEKLYKEK